MANYGENFPVKHTVNYNCDTLKVFLLYDCGRRWSANSFSDEDYHNNRLSSETKAPSSDEVKVLVWNCEGSAKFVSQSLRFESKFLTENFQRHPEFLRISRRESFRKLRIFDCFDWQFRCSTKSWWPPAMLFIKSQRRKMMTTIISWRYARSESLASIGDSPMSAWPIRLDVETLAYPPMNINRQIHA